MVSALRELSEVSTEDTLEEYDRVYSEELIWDWEFEPTMNLAEFQIRDSSIVVDGIRSYKHKSGSQTVVRAPMFTFKTELSPGGRPIDPGNPWRWNPDLEIDELHWVYCGQVIDKKEVETHNHFCRIPEEGAISA